MALHIQIHRRLQAHTCACPPATIDSGIPASTRSNIQTKIHRNEQTSQT
jgi:hypothetical protein